MRMDRFIFGAGMLYSVLVTLNMIMLFSALFMGRSLGGFELIANAGFESIVAALFASIPAGLLFTAAFLARMRSASELFGEAGGALAGFLIGPLLTSNTGFAYAMTVGFYELLFAVIGHVLGSITWSPSAKRATPLKQFNPGQWKIACSARGAYGVYELELNPSGQANGKFTASYVIPFLGNVIREAGQWQFNASNSTLNLHLVSSTGFAGLPHQLMISMYQQDNGALFGHDANGVRYRFKRLY